MSMSTSLDGNWTRKKNLDGDWKVLLLHLKIFSVNSQMDGEWSVWIWWTERPTYMLYLSVIMHINQILFGLGTGAVLTEESFSPRMFYTSSKDCRLNFHFVLLMHLNVSCT